jgi:hypothetical protein
MAGNLSKSDLLAKLKSHSESLGVKLTANDQDGLSGELESIKSKWWFGGRKAVYRMSCRLVEADRAVVFREAVIETSWGMPPPTVTVETETVSGWKRSGTWTDTSPGGGGSIEYANVRSALDRAVTDAGWQFRFEGGRAP